MERRARLREWVKDESRRAQVRRFLEREVWSTVPADQEGCAPDRAERERILGHSEEGV